MTTLSPEAMPKKFMDSLTTLKQIKMGLEGLNPLLPYDRGPALDYASEIEIWLNPQNGYHHNEELGYFLWEDDDEHYIGPSHVLDSTLYDLLMCLDSLIDECMAETDVVERIQTVYAAVSLVCSALFEDHKDRLAHAGWHVLLRYLPRWGYGYDLITDLLKSTSINNSSIRLSLLRPLRKNHPGFGHKALSPALPVLDDDGAMVVALDFQSTTALCRWLVRCNIVTQAKDLVRLLDELGGA